MSEKPKCVLHAMADRSAEAPSSSQDSPTSYASEIFCADRRNTNTSMLKLPRHWPKETQRFSNQDKGN